MSKLLQKQEILPAILATKAEVKLLASNNTLVRWLSVKEAGQRILTMGPMFDVLGTPKRVKAIREKNTARSSKWEPCYRNTSAPSLQPSIEYLRRLTA